jgi:hypothetical protein
MEVRARHSQEEIMAIIRGEMGQYLFVNEYLILLSICYINCLNGCLPMMRIASLCILALAGVAGYIQIDSRLPWAPFAIPAVLESELLVPAAITPVAAGKKPQIEYASQHS